MTMEVSMGEACLWRTATAQDTQFYKAVFGLADGERLTGWYGIFPVVECCELPEESQ